MAVVNTTVDNGTGTDYAVPGDSVDMGAGSAGVVQYNKIVDGTVGGTTAATVSSDGHLNVDARKDQLRIAVTSGGLTTATTAYTAGDQVATQFTLANAATVSGGTGRITKVVLMDETDIIGAYDVVFTRASITLAADNAAYAISDGDAASVEGIAQLAGSFDLGNNRIAQYIGPPIAYDCSGGTSLYASLICRVGHTFFGATTSLKLAVTVERD